MKTHKAKRYTNSWGANVTTSLCGRLDKSCKDGMNITDTDSGVTCGFCLKKLERARFSEVGRRNAVEALARGE